MYTQLKDKVAASSKYTRWFWAGLLLLAVILVGGMLLLRRRKVLERLSQLRLQLERKNRQLLDAQTVAATVHHEDAIDRHEATAAQIRSEIVDVEGQIADAEKEHQTVLAEIEQAGDWSQLAALRQRGNERVNR